MLNYYEVLGLSPSAHNAEIKRAYRRLAVVYHPDKNPDPSAEEVFKEINEAYEVLSDPDKKRGYDYLLQNLSGIASPEIQPEPPTRHRDPAYRPTRNKVRQQEAGSSPRQLMKQYLPYTQKVSMFCLVIALVFMLDYLLPHRTTPDTITSVEVYVIPDKHRSKYWKINTQAGHRMSTDRLSGPEYQTGQNIVVHASRLFNIPTALDLKGTVLKLGMSLYGNFIFGPIMLLVVSALAVLARRDVDYGFNLGVSSFMLLILLIVFLIVL